jgi:hypothetical protein
LRTSHSRRDRDIGQKHFEALKWHYYNIFSRIFLLHIKFSAIVGPSTDLLDGQSMQRWHLRRIVPVHPHSLPAPPKTLPRPVQRGNGPGIVGERAIDPSKIKFFNNEKLELILN